MDRLLDIATSDGSVGSAPVPTLDLVAAFGSNPGKLRMHLYRPLSARVRAPLVVVLHGCGQTAAGYETGSRWTTLARDHGFMVLYAEQQGVNNQRTCFNWFERGDITRGSGEVESIHQMIDHAIADHGADPKAVFICGLSAGGAMAGAMLATYPETFAGGAIIAGLPYGTASNTSEALESMFTGKVREAKVWGDAVRAASAFSGRRPGVAIWHGTADPVVKPINAGELVKQWTNVHGVGAEPPFERTIGTVTRREWQDESGRTCVIDYSLPGIGHGTPIDDPTPSALFFLPAGISATHQIADDWGLLAPPKPTLLARIGLDGLLS
jgi:poly(hydroxyalkanoate) depolymerase family esterase